jgi:hypothetical protein
LGYFTPEKVAELEADVRAVGAPLVGLIRSAKLQSFSQTGAGFVVGALATWLVL